MRGCAHRWRARAVDVERTEATQYGLTTQVIRTFVLWRCLDCGNSCSECYGGVWELRQFDGATPGGGTTADERPPVGRRGR